MNLDQQLTDALTILLYLVIFMVALGITEICVSMVQKIVANMKRMLK